MKTRLKYGIVLIVTFVLGTKETGDMNFENEERWIGIDEAAEHLGVKPSTIREWIKKKDIPANKIGKQWKFKKSELDDWVKSGKSAIQ